MTTTLTEFQELKPASSVNTSPFVLNKLAQRIENRQELEQQLARLQFHGIATPYKEKEKKIIQVKYQNIYLVAVFQQKILGIFQQIKRKNDNWINDSLMKTAEKNKFASLEKIPRKLEHKRVTGLAIRAVYALNLDYALVKIGVAVGTKPYVLNINSLPEDNEELAPLFEKKILDFIEKWENKVNNWSKATILGADLEFMLQGNNGKLILASKYLPKKGLAGCDQIWVNQDRTQLPLAELRPLPAKEPRDLVINIYKSMVVASKRIKDMDVKWLAGALPIKGYPIGGHIHFSQTWLNSFLLRALDNYLALMITVFEDKQGLARRPKYGFLGDYREQFHGGFEYRTLPSWIVSPELAKGVIALAKLIVENYIYLEQNPLEEMAIQQAYYSGDKAVLRPVVIKLWEELKELKDFSLYKNYLQPLEILLVNEYSWDETKDIRIRWLLPPYHKKTKSS